MANKKEIAGVDQIEELGRGTDTVMGHLSLGEVIIPRAFLDDPQVMQFLKDIYKAAGTDIAEFTVGDKANKINPETGHPEFFGFKGLKKIFKFAAPIALSVAAPGLGTALGTALGAGATFAPIVGGAALGAGVGGGTSALLGGKPFKDALYGGITGAASSALNSALSGGLDNTSLGRAIDSAYQGSALKDIYTGASGALDKIGAGVSELYKGSDLQSAFKSGGDALKSVGIDFGPTTDTSPVAVGGGASSYGQQDYPSLSTDKFASGGAGLDSLTQSLPTPGVETVANKSNNLAPILSAALGYNSNQNAAGALLKQQRANQELISGANRTALDVLLKQQQDNAALLDPYSGGFSFSPGDLTQDPGYQFNLEQGNQAADRANLARGNYFSGEALKEAQKFGQGLADNTYNTAFNRALQSRNAGLQGVLARTGINTDYGRSVANQAANNAALGIGVNTDIGNINANRIVNNGNLASGALATLLGGPSFTNTGALQDGFDIQEFLRRNGLGESLYAS